MKSFYKISFLVAGCMIAIGLMFGLVGVAFGGDHQLAAMEKNGELSYFYLPGSFHIGWKDDDVSDEWEDGKEDGEMESNEKDVFPANQIKNLEIKIGAAELEVIPYDGTDFKVACNYPENFEFKMTDKDTLTFKSKGIDNHTYKPWKMRRRKAKLYMPKSMEFESVDLIAGAGDIEMEEFSCRKMKLEVGAGSCSVKDFEAEELTFDIGAGSAEFSDAVIGKGTYNIGVGGLDFSGEITGDTTIECGMGSVSMDLAGRQEDYNYDVTCSMGSVSIGKSEIEGFTGSRVMDNDSDITFDITCNMGSVEMDF